MNTPNPATTPAPAPASAASKRKQKYSPTLEVDCQPDVDALSPTSQPSTPMAEQQRPDLPAAGRGSTKKKKKGTSPASQNMADATDPATQYLLATTSPRSDDNVGVPPASGGSAGPTRSQLRELLGQDRAAAGRLFSSAAGAEPTREGNDDDETVRGRTGEGRDGANTDSVEPWEDRCHPDGAPAAFGNVGRAEAEVEAEVEVEPEEDTTAAATTPTPTAPTAASSGGAEEEEDETVDDDGNVEEEEDGYV